MQSSKSNDQSAIVHSIDHPIDKRTLDERFYFQSLVDAALQMGRIDETTIDQYQNSLIALLTLKVDQFTLGNSSSVRVEVAEKLMRSNLFVISHYLKSFETADEALNCIISTPLNEVYDLGLGKVYQSIEHAKKLHRVILKTLTQTENETYTETVVDGIKGFFKLYNPSFEAQNIHITADYPTAKPIVNLDGIEFILAYLKAIYHENAFCCHFKKQDIHFYLRGYHPQCKVLIFNIFESILIGATACRLLEIEETSLAMTAYQLELLYMKLHGLSKKALYYLIKEAVVSLMGKLNLNRASTRNYILITLPAIVSRLYLALETDTLERTIYIKTASTENSKFLYHAAPKMDDALFREVLTELSKCRYSSDRVALILSEAKSIEDLEDFVEEALLTPSEISVILSKLSLVELAMLIDRHPLDPKIVVVDRTAQELLLTQCLEDYKNRLPEQMQLALKKFSYHLSK